MNIPGFQIIEAAGEGGMAIVYKAYQSSLDRLVAIKVLKEEFASDHNEIINFVREARSAAKIKHPNIIQMYDVAEIDGQFYFVMEFIAGKTLNQITAEEGPTPYKTALEMANTIASVLENAWDNFRIIHRDIKPENIMRDEDGTIKLADLGLSISRDSISQQAQAHGWTEGTPNYMSPEQATGQPDIDLRSDIYSLGATLYQISTGQIPFPDMTPHDTMDMQVRGKLRNPCDLNTDIPVGMAQLMARMMMKNPDERYQDWSACIADIRILLKNKNHTIQCDGDSTVIAPTTVGNQEIKIKEKVAPGKLPLKRKPIPEQTPVKMKIQQKAAPKITIVARPSGTEGIAATKASIAQKLPLWFSLSVNILIVIILGLVGYFQLKPPRLYKQTIIITPQTIAVTKEETPKIEPTPPPKPVQTVTKPVTPAVTNAAPAAATVDLDAYNEAVKKAAELLLSASFEDAKQPLLEKETAATGEIKSNIIRLKLMIDDVAQLPKIMEASLKAKTDRTTKMNIKGADKTIKIKSITGDKISAEEVKVLAGSTAQIFTPLNFNISDISVNERIKWIGPISSANRATMKCLLLMNAKRYQEAGATAKECGLLSEALTEAAAAKTQ